MSSAMLICENESCDGDEDPIFQDESCGISLCSYCAENDPFHEECIVEPVESLRFED